MVRENAKNRVYYPLEFSGCARAGIFTMDQGPRAIRGLIRIHERDINCAINRGATSPERTSIAGLIGLRRGPGYRWLIRTGSGREGDRGEMRPGGETRDDERERARERETRRGDMIEGG